MQPGVSLTLVCTPPGTGNSPQAAMWWGSLLPRPQAPRCHTGPSRVPTAHLALPSRLYPALLGLSGLERSCPPPPPGSQVTAGEVSFCSDP